MYGLPKVHKPSVPLRPILSMTGSPQFATSQWLVELWRPVLDYYSTRCVKDSFTFADKVRTATLSSTGHMCFFDIVSLFPNIPLKEVIDICANAIYHDDIIDEPPPLLKEQSFRKLLEMVTSGVEFSFDEVMYRPVDGVAMGSPLGQILANIFVGYHERKIPDDQWPEMYERYVDDIFSHFYDRHACDRFFALLNELHPALRFTREDEETTACLSWTSGSVGRLKRWSHLFTTGPRLLGCTRRGIPFHQRDIRSTRCVLLLIECFGFVLHPALTMSCKTCGRSSYAMAIQAVYLTPTSRRSSVLALSARESAHWLFTFLG